MFDGFDCLRTFTIPQQNAMIKNITTAKRNTLILPVANPTTGHNHHSLMAGINPASKSSTWLERLFGTEDPEGMDEPLGLGLVVENFFPDADQAEIGDWTVVGKAACFVVFSEDWTVAIPTPTSLVLIGVILSGGTGRIQSGNLLGLVETKLLKGGTDAMEPSHAFERISTIGPISPPIARHSLNTDERFGSKKSCWLKIIFSSWYLIQSSGRCASAFNET